MHFFGTLFCYTTRKDKENRKYYGVNFPIPDSITANLVKKIGELQIVQIFTCDTTKFPAFICDDCGFKDYEFFNGNFHFRRSFDLCSGNKAVDSLGSFIEQTLHVEKMFFQFIDSLPDGTYVLDRMDVVKSAK